MLILCFLVGLSLVWYYSSTPEGIYYDRNIAAEYAYWVFKDGQVYLKTPETTNFISTYAMSGGKWVTSSASSNEHTVVKPSLFGIRIENPTTHTNDRFVPRCGFSWMFKQKDLRNNGPE